MMKASLFRRPRPCSPAGAVPLPGDRVQGLPIMEPAAVGTRFIARKGADRNMGGRRVHAPSRPKIAALGSPGWEASLL